MMYIKDWAMSKPISKTVAATEFKAKCLRLINEMLRDAQPVTITKRGRPVAMLVPVSGSESNPSLLGALRGTVTHYEDPFLPAADASDWLSNQ